MSDRNSVESVVPYAFSAANTFGDNNCALRIPAHERVVLPKPDPIKVNSNEPIAFKVVIDLDLKDISHGPASRPRTR